MKTVGHTSEFLFGIYWWTWKHLFTRKKIKFWKNATNCWRYHHFTHVYQKSQSWCTVPETHLDRMFCHFGPFFAHSPPWQPGKSKFWKLKKRPGDIIILHMCTINDNDTMYGSWDRWYIWSATDIIFCHFGSYFALLPH